LYNKLVAKYGDQVSSQLIWDLIARSYKDDSEDQNEPQGDASLKNYFEDVYGI